MQTIEWTTCSTADWVRHTLWLDGVCAGSVRKGDCSDGWSITRQLSSNAFDFIPARLSLEDAKAALLKAATGEPMRASDNRVRLAAESLVALYNAGLRDDGEYISDDDIFVAIERLRDALKEST